MNEKVEGMEVLLIVDDEHLASVSMSEVPEIGISVTCKMDDTLRPNAVMGVLALALHAAVMHYKGEGRSSAHWNNIQPFIMDALMVNQEFMRFELILEDTLNGSEEK